MELPLSQPHFSRTHLLLLVVSNLLLWQKAASIPACVAEEGGCWDPLVETFNSAIQNAETLRKLAEQFSVELYSNKFSSGQFASFNLDLMKQDPYVLRAGTYCHSILTNPPNRGIQHISTEREKYLKILINYVGSWTSPLYHLVIELSAMQDVPESILSKAKEMEENNRKILDDIWWILNNVYPTAEMEENIPSWDHLSFLKSSDKKRKLLAMFNLSNCLIHDTKYTVFHLRILKCRMTGKGC